MGFTLIMGNNMIIEEISATDYEIGVINSISKKEGALRQQSKAPTFRPYLSGYLSDPDDQLWFPGSQSPHDRGEVPRPLCRL